MLKVNAAGLKEKCHVTIIKKIAMRVEMIAWETMIMALLQANECAKCWCAHATRQQPVTNPAHADLQSKQLQDSSQSQILQLHLVCVFFM